MSSELVPISTSIVYPESDGKPMADNTLQWDWMVKIVGELREQFARQEVFVAGDLFWYPVEGNPKEVTAPDALVVFGRPAGYRGSYKQWEEGNIGPQVVFEILSPSNTDDELDAKLGFYERYGVEEYFIIDPYLPEVIGYHRRGNRLSAIRRITKGHVSPRLGIRFELTDGELRIIDREGRVFRTREERVAEFRAELERANVELERTAAAFEEEHTRAITAERSLETLAAKLRELGVNPDDLLRPAG